jgi:catechol 2,3-dioxygenase-like lactoylglutathione lyase family enzyme
MTFAGKGIGAITLFIADVERSKAWYTNTFDLPIVYQDDVSAVVKFDNTLINLLTRHAAHELIAPGVVASGEAGSTFQLTVWVDDADAACADLERRGLVMLNGPMNREWGQRTACFADPDGHIWEIAQSLS